MHLAGGNLKIGPDPGEEISGKRTQRLLIVHHGRSQKAPRFLFHGDAVSSGPHSEKRNDLVIDASNAQIGHAGNASNACIDGNRNQTGFVAVMRLNPR